MRISNHSRGGFTLVEVLVAAGLCMIIMTVITQAFQRGMDTLSQLKSVGELQQRLRSFETTMRTDLEADHFDSRYGPRVSDQRLDKLIGATNPEAVEWRPPTLGFFAIRQGTTLSTLEGTNPNDGLISTRAIDHTLHMTVRRSGARSDKNFSTTVSSKMLPVNLNLMQTLSMNQIAVQPNVMVSDWGEVIYFLDTANPLGKTPGGTNLYGLYRRTRVVPQTGSPLSVSWTNATSVSGAFTDADRARCLGVSYSPVIGAIDHAMNDPRVIRDPRNRLGGLKQDRTTLPIYDRVTAEQDSAGNNTGADLLIADVLSFEIKCNWDGGTILPGGTGLNTTYEFPFSDLPVQTRNQDPNLTGTRLFDTWYDTADPSWLKSDAAAGTIPTANMVPQLIRLRAMQIKVRVWDRKNNIARQVTIIQDL